MKVELFPFQQKALANLRMRVMGAAQGYNTSFTPQIVSFTAPTGAGKTIIMASLIESIFYGDELYIEQPNYVGMRSFPEQPEAIFVWLSDSPELNAQSRMKIDFKADKIGLQQCVTIEDESFDREILEDGHIYFLNTQKLGKNSNLTRNSDTRQFTIWETLRNTANRKGNRLYFIIDEAHRGMQGREAGKATSIMQKFILGSQEDGLPAMPVVIGMSATPERFNALVGMTTSTKHYVVVTPDEVRASGLLKDRIVIRFPDIQNGGNAMAVLQAAADEWKDKWDHWTQYCQEQHYAYVNPVFVVQVENGSGDVISATDMDDCLLKISQRTGFQFTTGEVVHTFGQTTSTIQIAGLDIPYVEPSRISEDRNIKVVFFKENLSTGWDCPRAETMMSFRHATDATYIAQLLGRMVRTPMQMHINVDDSLNDVHLYLPYFDQDTVGEIVDQLTSVEGGAIPADIDSEEIGNKKVETLSVRPRRKVSVSVPSPVQQPVSQPIPESQENTVFTPVSTTPESPAVEPAPTTKPSPVNTTSSEPNQVEVVEDEFDRMAVVEAINNMGLLTYNIRLARVSNYLTALYKMARLISQSGLNPSESKDVIGAIVEQIHAHIENLKIEGKYDDLVEKHMQVKLNSQVFDVFGESVDYDAPDLFTTTDSDIDRQFRVAECKLGKEGVANEYGRRYGDEEYPNGYKLDVIIFVGDDDCIDKLNAFAKIYYQRLINTYRRKVASLEQRYKDQYDSIATNADLISEHNYSLPFDIQIPADPDGTPCNDHLFVNKLGVAQIKLNGWENGVLNEERKRPDYICWLRNPSRDKPWALKIPYKMGNENKPAYPDFIIVRKDPDAPTGYVVDLLEPHDPTRTDNLGKAQGFAEYARKVQDLGRIQLIRKLKDSAGKERFKRLDMSLVDIQEKVLSARSTDDIDAIFRDYGFFD